MENLPAQQLSESSVALLSRTISCSAFWMITMDRIIRKQGLSVVRMADGEHKFMESYSKFYPDEPLKDVSWILCQRTYNQLGMTDITARELRARLVEAVKETEYWAPSLSGYYLQDYNIQRWFEHPQIVDNYFANEWSNEMIGQLLERASGVAFVGRQRPKPGIRHIPMQDWRETDRAMAEAKNCSEQLILVAGGPGGKYIIPAVAKSSKVVLDVGQTAWRFIQ